MDGNLSEHSEDERQTNRYTIEEFNARCTEIHSGGGENALGALCRFALTGEDLGNEDVQLRFTNHNVTRQMVERGDVVRQIDFDSLLGMTTDMPIKTDLAVYPLFLKQDVLEENLHIKMPVQKGQGVTMSELLRRELTTSVRISWRQRWFLYTGSQMLPLAS